MGTALIGFLGVILGLLTNEYFRRKGRIDVYSKEIFQKRLGVYEELYLKVHQSCSTATDVIENPALTKEERHSIWSKAVLDLAEFTDKNALYLNEQITVHCLMTMMGVEDIYYLEDPEERDRERAGFFEHTGKSKAMIKQETGLQAIEKFYGSISKAKHKSEYLTYLKKAKKAYAKSRKSLSE
jgi:hypothetical protein